MISPFRTGDFQNTGQALSAHRYIQDSWMETAAELKIDELDRYINGLQNDLKAVKNAIIYPYNNGLAEGSVNKIRLTKRIMYGRNSFALLKAKLLINEYFHQIN